MGWCASDPVTLNQDCAVPADTPTETASDAAPYLVAAAIQQAAVDIVGLDCHSDAGVEWGPVEPGDSRCCGAILTGIVTPFDFGTSSCFQLGEYRFELLVTWDQDRHSVAQVAAETQRLSRRVIAQTGCRLAGQTGGWSRRSVELESSSNSLNERPHLKLIFRTTR